MRTRPLEKEVQAAIIQAFKVQHRITLHKIDAGAAGMRSGLPKGGRGYSGLPAGFPDLMGVIPPNGRALFIEVKRPGQKPRPNQTDFLERFRAAGCVAFWADSVDSALAQYEDQRVEATAQELHMVARIREALGDNGKRMFSELLAYCRELVRGRAA